MSNCCWEAWGHCPSHGLVLLSSSSSSSHPHWAAGACLQHCFLAAEEPGLSHVQVAGTWEGRRIWGQLPVMDTLTQAVPQADFRQLLLVSQVWEGKCL